MVRKERILHTLATLRRDRKITQEELAEILGVTRQTIIAIEGNKYTPSLCLAIKIADYFERPVEEIFALQIGEE